VAVCSGDEIMTPFLKGNGVLYLMEFNIRRRKRWGHWSKQKMWEEERRFFDLL
jgi:hypothetical protein